jgi:hypothetical protein
VTSSGITQVWPDIERNANRVGDAHSRNNFGMLEVEWAAGDEESEGGGGGDDGDDEEDAAVLDNTKVRMVIRDVDDIVLTNHTVTLSELTL